MADTAIGKNFHLFLASLLSIAGIVLCNALFGWSASTSYDILWAGAFAGLAVGTHLYFSIADKRLRRCFFVYGGLFAAMQALGYRLQAADSTGLAGWALCIGIGICFAPAAAYCFILLSRLLSKARPAAGANPKLVFRIGFLVIFISWIPVFLAYYPGLFTYDVGVQIPQVLSGSYSARHPLLHTLFIGGFYLLGGSLGNETLGAAASTLLQMVIMSAIFARFFRYLYLQRAPRFLWLGSMIAFAFFPVHSILAISATKDVLFTGFLLLFIIRLHQLSRDPALMKSARWVLLTGAEGVLACLFRNNAVFSLILFIPLCVWLIPKAYRLRCLALALSVVVAFFCLNAGLKAAFNAHDRYLREYVSVPSQQLARVYTLHQDDYDGSDIIKGNVPAADEYIPYIADNTKGSAQVVTTESMVSFLKLWVLVGLRYPTEYIDAFLLNTQGYWWLNDTTYAAVNSQGYLSTDTSSQLSITRTSLFPGLESLYETLFTDNAYQKIPVLSFLFAPSLYVWLILFSLFRGLALKRKDLVMVSGLLLCYLVSLLTGPCVLVRYAYPFFVCVPFLLLPLRPSGTAAASLPAAPAPAPFGRRRKY